MRSLWYDEKPAFHGRYVDFEGVAARPRPVQRPIPVVVGGHSEAALRRAVRYGDGWYGWRLDLEQTAERIAALRAISRNGVLPHISITPARRLDAETVRAYGELGVDRLIVLPRFGLPLPDLVRFVEENAPRRLDAKAADHDV